LHTVVVTIDVWNERQKQWRPETMIRQDVQAYSPLMSPE
jgi:hypothetical protein